MRRILALAALCLALPAAAHADACLAPGEASPLDPGAARLAGIVARIEAAAPDPDPLLALWSASDIALCLADGALDARGFLDVADRRIVLSADIPDALLVPILVHELRHLDQVALGACPTPTMSRDSLLTVRFAMEADAQAIATLYAWMLRERADPEPWAALLPLEHYGDIAEAFARTIGATGDVSVATADAFDAWYADPWRVERYYHAACSGYYDLLDETKALPSYEDTPTEALTALCRLPDGTPYACTPRLPARP